MSVRLHAPKAIDGLMASVKNELERDPCSGHLFVFVSRRCDRVHLAGRILTYRSERSIRLVTDVHGDRGHLDVSAGE
jgi:hypothetical protein